MACGRAGPGTLPSMRCPCGSTDPLASCCGRYLDGEAPAPTPEALMRSRYTAFSLGTPEAIEYLVVTHHPDHREPDLAQGLAATVRAIDAWEGLEVLSASEDGDAGTVTFVACYRQGRERGELRERSSFVREGGRWFYTSGSLS